MSINEEYIEPKLRAAVRINEILGYQVVYHVAGILKINGKIIDKYDSILENNKQLLYEKPDSSQSSLDMIFDFNISKKALDEINLYRKQAHNKKREVKFTIEFYVEYMASPINTYNMREGNVSKYLLSTPDYDKSLILKLSSEHFTVEHTINSSDWLLNFAPKLGAGEYEMIELPKLNIDNSDKNFKSALEHLETAKKELYELRIGSSQTALRNSIKAFNKALMGLGYAAKDEKGHDKADYAKIFSNNNMSQLADSLQKWLYGTSSRGSESTAPHVGIQIEGYEVESMIFIAYSLYKMVFERLKNDEISGGGLN